MLKRFLEQCVSIEFEKPKTQEVSRIISKALACAHESLRRSRRGELFYAQSLLERVRSYIVLMEDWINNFEPKMAIDLKLEQRISSRIQTELRNAYPALDDREIENALMAICVLLSEQIVNLHNIFTLDRRLGKDLAAVQLIINKQIGGSDATSA